MKAAAIIAALGIALIVTMGPAPASAQTTVVRECGGQYTVARYNSDGSAIGVWNKQLSDEGTIYTAGKTWKLVEGDPDRFVSDGGAQLQVIPCDATPGSGTRGVSVRQVQGTQSSTTLVRNTGTSAVTLEEAATSQFATSFTTGANSLGYTLTRVQMGLFPTSAVSKYSVSIRANSSGIPGATLGTLESGPVQPGSLKGVDFPASGIHLAADTTYWLVTSVNGSVKVLTTAEDGESGDSLPGWDVGDDRISNSPSWNTSYIGPRVYSLWLCEDICKHDIARQLRLQRASRLGVPEREAVGLCRQGVARRGIVLLRRSVLEHRRADL